MTKSAEFFKKYVSIRIVYFFLIGLAIILSGCSNCQYELENLDTAKKLVENYYEYGSFDSECKSAYDEAKSKIDTINVKPKSVAIFDVDETALSNYYHTKEIGFGYVRNLWHQWLLKADDPPIPETKKFYDWLLSKKIDVIFLTGRYSAVYDVTKKNLISAGYTTFDTLIVRSDDESDIPAAEFKAKKREELVKNGYTIVASVGDQWSDLVGGNAGIKIKLPNYLYLID